MPILIQAKATCPDAEVTDTLDGVAVLNGYTDTVDDGNGNPIPNPQTKAQFAQDVIDNFLTTLLINHNKAWKDKQATAVIIPVVITPGE